MGIQNPWFTSLVSLGKSLTSRISRTSHYMYQASLSPLRKRVKWVEDMKKKEEKQTVYRCVPASQNAPKSATVPHSHETSTHARGRGSFWIMQMGIAYAEKNASPRLCFFGFSDSGVVSCGPYHHGVPKCPSLFPVPVLLVLLLLLLLPPLLVFFRLLLGGLYPQLLVGFPAVAVKVCA